MPHRTTGDYFADMVAAEHAHLARDARHAVPEPTTLHMRDAIDAAESTARLHKTRDSDFARNDLGDEYVKIDPPRDLLDQLLWLGVYACLVLLATVASYAFVQYRK